MFILYILFTLICCLATAYLIENRMASILKSRDEQNHELFEKLSNYIYENKQQIQDNIRVTNQLTNKVFYNK